MSITTTSSPLASSYLPPATRLDDVIAFITGGKPLPPRVTPMLPTILASSARDGLEQIIAGPGATQYR